MSLLGDDGRGFELARKLESHGVWRSWLGDSIYSSGFTHFLSSPAAWDSFMRADASKSKAQIQLQLRARALLFDKASVSLFLRPDNPSLSLPISELNPNYLELHGDDIYFTLEDTQDADQHRQGKAVTSAKSQSKFYGAGSRYTESEVDALPKRSKLEELPETWYAQFYEKFKASKSYNSLLGDRESEKRTPEQMSTYLKVLENHKRRRVAFMEDKNMGFPNSALDSISNLRMTSVISENTAVDGAPFFPETMFTLNCVPDSAILQTRGLDKNESVEFNGVLDNLPQIMSKSPVINPIMIERLGIRPEYLNMEQAGHQSRGKNGSQGSRKLLSQEQALTMSQKVVARLLTNVGFESSMEVPSEVFSQFLSSHICKLGRMLKLLADSYRKQCSAVELLRMFLQTAGHSNLRALAELVKDSTRNIVPKTQVQVPGIQSQFQTQLQPQIQHSQQIPRQMSQQIHQQINNSQYLAFQQQQQFERMRRRQQSVPRAAMGMHMNVDKDRPLVQVKMESPDFSLENNAFAGMNARHPQLQQLRQQELAARAQANNAYRPVASPQTQQIQSPNMGMVRSPPVKVDGFQELMGGDGSKKHDSEDNRLLSPQK